jgi:hypothetical protein
VGNWLPASCQEINDPDTAARVDRLLIKKYGLMKLLFSFSGKRKKIKNTILEVRPDGQLA